MTAWLRPHRGGDEDAPPVSGRTWRLTTLGLHTALVVFVAGAAVTVGADGGPAARVWTGLGALAALAVAYAAAGAVAIAREAPRRAVAYLTVLVVALGLVAAVDPTALFLLFPAYPQIWFLTERPRPGTGWTVLLTAAVVAGYAWPVASGRATISDAVITAVTGVGLSLAMGLWVARVIDQSRERGTLLARLEAAQTELAAAHRQQGVLAERERLAREVHDTLAQGYTSIVMLSQTASTALPHEPALAAERLALIEEVARDNLREARSVVAAFAPADLAGSTLADALRRLADRFTRETATAVRVELDDCPADLPRPVEVVLLRAAQEALTNVRRHARASTVTLRVSAGPRLRVEDDGIGFDPSEAAAGLGGLRRRLLEAGGTLDVTSSPGAGTRLTARLDRP